MRYDLLILGDDPAGRQAALAAARMNKRVALVQPERSWEAETGPCLGLPDDRRQMERQGVDLLWGETTFVDPHRVEVRYREEPPVPVSAGSIVIACGTRPARPAGFGFDGAIVCDPDEALRLERLPEEMVIVGGGETGIRQAALWASRGVDVTLVDEQGRLLDFCDREIVEALLENLRRLGVRLRLWQRALGAEVLPNDTAVVVLENGELLTAETVVVAVGRLGATEGLNLQAAGIEPDERGRLWCDETGRTWTPHIYGVGSVVGFPEWSRLLLEQGRRTVVHAVGSEATPCEPLLHGVRTLPEIRMVGRTEQELMVNRQAYEVVMTRWDETFAGAGEPGIQGQMKILFDSESHRLLGVHCLGGRATELARRAQTVIGYCGTVDDLQELIGAHIDGTAESPAENAEAGQSVQASPHFDSSSGSRGQRRRSPIEL